MDYIIEPVFNKLFSASEEIEVSFDNQVILSQLEMPEHRTNNEAKKSEYNYPGTTYAYSANGPMIIRFNKSVQVKHFWLRVHRPSEYYLRFKVLVERIKCYHLGQIVID